MDKRSKISLLVEKAKGDRTLVEYAEVAQITPAALSKIISRNVIPSRKTIEKLTSEKAKPQGGVTKEDMLVAAGYQKDYINHLEKTVVQSMESSGGVRKSFLEILTRFRNISRGIIYSSLIEKNLFAQLEERDVYTFKGNAPDLMIKIASDEIKSWWFFLVNPYMNGEVTMEDLEHELIRLIGMVSMFPSDETRKISFVTSNSSFFDMFNEYKDSINYRGELSVVFIDEEVATVIDEIYLAHYQEYNSEILLK